MNVIETLCPDGGLCTLRYEAHVTVVCCVQ